MASFTPALMTNLPAVPEVTPSTVTLPMPSLAFVPSTMSVPWSTSVPPE